MDAEITMLPPTSRLPPIRKISSCTSQSIHDALTYLRILYNPEVRGSRRIFTSTQITPPSVHHGMNLNRTVTPLTPSAESTPPDLDAMRSDSFERAYSLRWLTTLISQATETDGHMSTMRWDDVLIHDAASLLAICAGTAAAGTLTRVFSFTSTRRPDWRVQVQLTDVPLDNHDFASVGAQTWGGACVLAEAIVEDPTDFALVPPKCPIKDTPRAELRVLELGAGTGLVSLTLAKLLQSIEPRIADTATIVATDFYPSVLSNLKANIAGNFPDSADSASTPAVHIVSHFLDWSAFPTVEPRPALFERPFDLVLGADIIYEAEHAVWIKSCLALLLRKPKPIQSGSTSSPALFHLIIPLRQTHEQESNTIEQVFPSEENLSTNYDESPKLVIHTKEIILCDAGTGPKRGNDEDHVKYAYYKIGWS